MRKIYKKAWNPLDIEKIENTIRVWKDIHKNISHDEHKVLMGNNFEVLF